MPGDSSQYMDVSHLDKVTLHGFALIAIVLGYKA